MPQRAYLELRSRFSSLNGVRPTPPGTLGGIEDALGVDVPDDFMHVCEFYDGTGVVSESMAPICVDPDGDGVVALTRQFRSELALPANYLVLGASETTVVLLDCNVKKANGAAAVCRVAREALPRLAVGTAVPNAKGWPSFADYFRDLLDQEEAN